MPKLFKEMARAIWWGIAASGGPALLFTVPIGVGALIDGAPEGLLMMIFPLLFAGAMVVPAFVFAGLPITKLFQSRRIETRTNYVMAGMLTGLVTPFIIASLFERPEAILSSGAILAFFGAIGGATSGNVWGKWREAEAIIAAEEEAPLRPRSKPDSFLS